MTASLVIDIETAPLPQEQLRSLWMATAEPIAATGSQAPLEQRVQSVKCAQLRKLSEHQHSCEPTPQTSFELWKAKAALSALTGQVVAIGYNAGSGIRIECVDDLQATQEANVITSFWQATSKVRHAGGQILGFNSLGFDLPFLIQRSWILGLEVPRWVRSGRYFDTSLVDLLEVWRCGVLRSEIPQKLDTIARVLGIGAKPDGIRGEDFARLFFSDEPKQREQALDYLRCDIEITTKLAQRMGLLRLAFGPATKPPVSQTIFS